MRHSIPSQTARRQGFTLVELLVVIAIIGILVGLLLPAVQSARESGRNTQCKNNIRNLALAMQQYDTAQGELPGYINALQNANGPAAEGRRASWVVMLFPYLENGPLWDSWSRTLPNASPANPDYVAANWTQIPSTGVVPELALFLCPSDPFEGEGVPVLSYVVNAGQALSDTTRQNGVTDTPVREIPQNRETAANGVFFDQSKSTAIIRGGAVDGREGNPVIKMSMNYITANDGGSKTLMISENLHTVYWAYDGAGTSTPDDTASNLVEAIDNSVIPDVKHAFGFVWHNAVSADANLRRINGARDELSPESVAELVINSSGDFGEKLGYPSSQHPGGVNVAFCDGSISFLSDNLTDRVYAQLMTSNRKRSKYFDAPFAATLSAADQDQASDRKLAQPADDEF